VEALHRKAAQLEVAVGGTPSLSTQHQHKESPSFVQLFPNNTLIYMEGGVDTAWNASNKSAYGARLLHIKGKKEVRVVQAPLTYKGLNSGDCFILDAGLDLWQWNGKGCNQAERRKASEVLRGFINERTGKPKTHTIDEGEETDAFWHLLGGKGPIPSAEEGGEDDIVQSAFRPDSKLYKLSDNETGELKLSLVATGATNNSSLLQDEDVFVFDAGVEIFVWVGKGASAQEKKNAVPYGRKYAEDYRREGVPVTRLIQGGESDYFKQAFSF